MVLTLNILIINSNPGTKQVMMEAKFLAKLQMVSLNISNSRLASRSDLVREHLMFRPLVRSHGHTLSTKTGTIWSLNL